ncbi:MAG: hypothetical protein CMP56_02395 [Flavobacteriales bacterium]|nr:hypothetical protein [Flavobacteriales bacterium]
MSIYKYVVIFCILFVSCEKNDFHTWQLCDGVELIDNKLSVLSFNRLNGTSINSVSNIIETISPDVIGLQESFDVGVEIADRFNYCFYGHEETSTAILSKYSIEVINDSQCKIYLNETDYINFFNIHFPAYPYQPYDIRDTLITTAAQAIHQAEQTRGLYIDQLLESINSIDNNMPIVVVGDFNEPSHLDWVYGAENPTRFQFNNDSSPFIVDWPASNKMLDVGLVDVYRQLFPNPLDYPGYTWTPYYNVNEVHDRIDFIYHDNQMNVESFSLIGPDNLSDILILNYESDHRAIFSVFNTTF